MLLIKDSITEYFVDLKINDRPVHLIDARRVAVSLRSLLITYDFFKSLSFQVVNCHLFDFSVLNLLDLSRAFCFVVCSISSRFV